MTRFRSMHVLALLLTLLAASCAGGPAGNSGKGYDHYAIGDTAAPTPRPVTPGLLLVGGGDWPYAAYRWMFDRAGNGHVVVLRASYADENQKEMYQQIGGVASVQTLVFHERRASYDPRVLEILARADGIYAAGGDQSNYVRYWQGTPVEDAINRHVAAGKPFGGTSAGLAIQGRWVYGAMDGHSLTSATALADPHSSQLTIVSDFLRLEPLYSAGVLTDTHFAERERQGRLIAMMAKVQREHPGSPVVGLGIDEKTALAIDGQGQGRVFSEDGGYAWVFQPGAAVAQAPGRGLGTSLWKVVGVGTSSRLHLGTWQVDAPAFQVTVQARDGRLAWDPALPK